MTWNVRSRFVGLAAILALAPSVGLQAQEQGRFEVLIPNFRAADGSNKKFGEKVAKDLRELINTLPTHQPVDKKDMERAIKKFDLDKDNLECPLTVQLASQMGSQVALCASYVQQGDQWVVSAEFYEVSSGESFVVSPATVGEDQDQQAAQHIFDEFDRYTAQLRAATFCAEYAASSAWTPALEQCDRALELNPKATGTRYIRARVLFETQRPDEALQELRRVLEDNPVHEDALQLAGYISATEGADAEALDYYSRYLELSPGSAAVRMKIAYELAQAGDPGGAMQLIQEGLDRDQENIDLWEQLGGFAFAAGQEVNDATPKEDANTVAPDAVPYFRTAIEAYERVFEAKGAETPANELRSIIAAYVQLGDLTQAISFGSQALETHPEEAGLWSIYADALQRDGQLDQALTALDRVAELDPEYPNVGLRQGKWLLEAGRLSEATEALKSLVSADPEQADGAGRMVVAQAYAKGVQPKNWSVAVQTLNTALQIPSMSDKTIQQINFWLGYSILQGAIPAQEARTLETAQATLPRFQRAKQLFGNVGNYPSEVNVNLGQLLQAVDQYIAIQESIIKRGR